MRVSAPQGAVSRGFLANPQHSCSPPFLDSRFRGNDGGRIVSGGAIIAHSSPMSTSPPNNIFLTGFSGCGKTTVGREAARLLGWAFVDTDDEIVAAEGVAIEDIFRERGEDEFRRIERETVARVAARDNQVVSTGGGVIMDARNRAVMEANGVVVLLEARTDTILERLQAQAAADSDAAARPMLDSDDLRERVHSLKALRQFNYTQAHWTTHTDFLTPSEAAAEVVRGFEIISARRGEVSHDPP